MQSMSAQMVNGITEILGVSVTNSIVRAFDDDHTLIYTYDGITMKGFFILYRHSSGTTFYFETPSKIQVMDMEIDGDNVYFCGNESSNHAFVGQFDVLGCFYGTAQFYYCVIPGALPYRVEMNTATKMTTMEYGGQKYILGLGDATHDYSDPTPYVASNLFSATMYPGGFWFFRVDYQKVCPYRYTDIDCSDNYVVVTAVDANDYVHILPCYHHPDFFYHNYFVYTGEFAIGGYVEDLQLLVKSMNGDRFTIAYVPKGRNWIDLVDLTIPLPSTLIRYSTQPSISTPYLPGYWKIYELRHNNVTDYPLLLGKMALPPYDIYDTWVTEFDWGGTSVSQNNMLRKNFISLDGVSGFQNYVVTDLVSPLSLGKENLPIPGTQCFNYRSVAISSVSFVPEMVFLSNHYPCNEYNPTTLFTPEILPLEPKTICE